MRQPLLASLFALCAAHGAALAQFRGVDITSSISAGVAAPVPCEASCSDLTVTRAAGVLVKGVFGVEYRGVRWGDQSRSSAKRLSTDMVAFDLHVPTTGRLRPFASAGVGRSSARVRVDYGHMYDEYGPATSLPTAYLGIGLDMRLFKRVAFTPMISWL